jgi:hypothetical protein
MTILRAFVAVAAAALVIWLTVQLVNRADRRDWLSRMMRPVMLKSLIAYFVISAATIPFLDELWFGEFPVLALIQIPKVALARWCQDLVMRGMHLAGLSRGSISPDLIASRPWGLLLAYVLALGPVFAFLWYRRCKRPSRDRTPWVLAAVVVIDFTLMLLLAGGPGLTIY